MADVNQNNSDALNKLLEKILIDIFDQAGHQYEDRSGRKIKISNLQKMKMDLAKKGVEMLFNRIGKGNVEKNLDKVVDLTNKHLPYVLKHVGEEAVVERLKQMDEIVDQEAVDILNEAGATELAALLNKALPSFVPVEKVAEVKADSQPPLDTEKVADIRKETAAESETTIPTQSNGLVSDQIQPSIGPKIVDDTSNKEKPVTATVSKPMQTMLERDEHRTRMPKEPYRGLKKGAAIDEADITASLELQREFLIGLRRDARTALNGVEASLTKLKQGERYAPPSSRGKDSFPMK